MHPAPSVIIFSTLSGAGFGLLFWLGLGLPAVTGWWAFLYFGVGYALAVGGLLAATLHLGHPERALLAFTQWRSSWLSREGIAAVAALLLMAIPAAAQVFAATQVRWISVPAAILCIATVCTTAMIYAQLRSVPRWHHWSTPVLFLTLSLGGGALLAGQNLPAILLLLAATALQLYWWHDGDSRFARSGTTLATATGLGGTGTVRAFEPPHTGTNYLLQEMAYQVARRHVQRLRLVALICGYVLPIILLHFSWSLWQTAIAGTLHIVGILASRWLFFAEAEHVVGLYYGQR